MTDDQITDLARLLSAGAAPDLPAGRLQILKEHLMVEYRLAAGNRRPAPQRRRVRRPLIAAVSAVGVLAAVAATATALVLSGGQPAPGSPSAVELLAKVANAAARQPAPAVGNSEFMYIRSEVAFATYTDGSQVATMEPLHERQVWRPVANICDWGLVIEEGQRTSLALSQRNSPSTPITCNSGNVGNPTYRLLQSLPTNPRTLLNLIYAFNGPGAATAGTGQGRRGLQHDRESHPRFDRAAADRRRAVPGGGAHPRRDLHRPRDHRGRPARHRHRLDQQPGPLRVDLRPGHPAVRRRAGLRL